MSRSGQFVVALGLVEAAIVAEVASSEPNDGTLSVVAALLLAPVAVWAVAGIGERVRGPGFGMGAALAYAALPFVGRHLFYGPLRQSYSHGVLPELVGTRGAASFALGVGLAVAIRVLPERATGAAGIAAALVALVLWFDTDWTTLYGDFHESTWSPTLVCVLPFACVLGAAFRRPSLGLALGGWLAFVVLRAAAGPYGSFWTALGAATPALAVLIASLALLVPPLRQTPAVAPPVRAH